MNEWNNAQTFILKWCLPAAWLRPCFCRVVFLLQSWEVTQKPLLLRAKQVPPHTFHPSGHEWFTLSHWSISGGSRLCAVKGFLHAAGKWESGSTETVLISSGGNPTDFIHSLICFCKQRQKQFSHNSLKTQQNMWCESQWLTNSVLHHEGVHTFTFHASWSNNYLCQVMEGERFSKKESRPALLESSFASWKDVLLII